MSDFTCEEVEGGGLIKLWTKGVQIEDQAMQQLRNTAKLPFIYKHVAAMPDTHWGMGATVGSVIATKGAIVPAAVGVDIGCGMCAWQLTIKADQLPDNLHTIRTDIEAAIPHGRTDNGGKNDRGAWHDLPVAAQVRWVNLLDRYNAITTKHPKARSSNADRHMGSLGTGNHFIELCADEDNNLWVMLHSGSRGAGNRIGTYFIERAKEEMRRYYIDKFLPDIDLAYLVEKSELFDDYVEAVHWAQDFASENRLAMMFSVLDVLHNHLPLFTVTEEVVNCHHNYISRENHFGTNVLITRKGAVRARKSDLGIIPGSMGTGSFIVRGLGNEQSFCSCSHGAGRAMSRTQAKRMITLEQHIKAMDGIECRTDIDVIDESPAAYKDISAVIAAQSDLIEVVHHLTQLINVKG
jgi:tRNA-splicing ligase RtcB